MWLKFCDYTKIAPPWLILFGNSQDANPFGYVSSLVYLYRTLITSSSLTQIPLSHSHLNLFVIPYEATVLCRRVYTRKLITEGLWLSLPSLKTKGPVSCDSLWGKGTSFLPHPGYFFLPASSTLLHLCAFTQTLYLETYLCCQNSPLFYWKKNDPYTLFLPLSLIILTITSTWSFYFTNYVNSSEFYSYDSYIFSYHQLSSIFSLGPISIISTTDLSLRYSSSVHFPLITPLSLPPANPKPELEWLTSHLSEKHSPTLQISARIYL